jgi:rRNA processing protein Krr1/Pno1
MSHATVRLCTTVTVPRHLHKYVIGTKGSIIKNIQEQCGNNTRIILTQDSEQITITSDTEMSLKNALEQVKSIHEQHRHLVDANSAVSKSFTVPGTLHKFLIGTGGKVVQEIKQQTHCQVDFVTQSNQIKISCSEEPTLQRIDTCFELFLNVLRTHVRVLVF